MVLDRESHPWHGRTRAIKWCEDKFGAVLLLLLLAPLMLLIALAIKCDSPGPVIFRQKRTGWRSREFTIHKFRTMRHDPQATDLSPVRRHDPRVTPVGRWLRRTSLDELPQLFDVLAGSMSLVGPRPFAVAHAAEFTMLLQEYRWRERVRPGMTGWAQINGLRGELASVEDLKQRIAHDLYYIEHWSLGLDLIILARSALLCCHDSKAY